MYEETKMEKITVNLPPVDLGKIDILIESGAFPSRTEFIRSAIRKAIEANEILIKSRFEQSQMTFEEDIEIDENQIRKLFGMGMFSISANFVRKAYKTGKKIRIHVVGVLSISKDADPEEVKATFDRVKVYGIIRASPEVKDVLSKISRRK